MAITRFATRPLLTSPQTSEVLLEVANFGRAPVKANVELAFDGRLLDVKPLGLAPGGERLEVFDGAGLGVVLDAEPDARRHA